MIIFFDISRPWHTPLLKSRLAPISSVPPYANHYHSPNLYATLPAAISLLTPSFPTPQPSDAKLIPKYPIERAVPEDWTSLELLWEHTLRNELECNAEEIALCITDAPMSVEKAQHTMQMRRKMAEIAFEQLGVKAITIGSQPVLSLFSTGRTRGCVVEVGDGASFTVPVFEGLKP